MDIEDLSNKYSNDQYSNDRYSKRFFSKYNSEDYEKLENIVKDFISEKTYSLDNYSNKYRLSHDFMNDMRKKYKISPRKEEILFVYKRLAHQKRITDNSERGQLLLESFKKKDVREMSGVMVFAILSSPYPETGEFAPTFKKDIKYNRFYVNSESIIGTSGIEVCIDPITGIIVDIIGSDTVKINTGNIVFKVGDDVNSIINPLTGELRQNFSCPFNCYFCPTQPDMPKSYEDKEPAVARSLRHGWNPVLSMRDRFEQYVYNGMDIDKLEVIIKGGTWTSYNSYYRKQFCRDIFFAANTFWDNIKTVRSPFSLDEEQKINETSKAHIIGITIETRPDYITDENIVEFRECGITRVELGFQHTDNKILKKVNRQHTVEDSINGIAKLLACGFKVDIHLMPGLPNSTFEKDKEMVKQVLTTNLFRADQLKWYPTIVTPYTIIKKWYDKGRYKPWIEDEEKLMELSVYFKSLLNPWNRINRIQRDFTADFICGGSKRSNLGDMLKKELFNRGISCKCIRCREIRNNKINQDDIKMIVRKYQSYSFDQIATEYFISYESNNLILGFLRLRLDPNSGLDIFSELYECAMIRELHVYGKMNKVNNKTNKNTQHLGLGTKLIEKAKEIAKENGYKKISVISGVGVRNYYRKKHNFKDGKYYLIANI
uniref:tRNA carboxymethyluridine synthase n=1 Tax=Pithovirus LCPAC302 TaxID=2506593 RepID=A0A481Z6I6_9VIRU|nr:MAG: acetyltransferase (GNAT) family protein [Pithovirus LCPAC302]